LSSTHLQWFASKGSGLNKHDIKILGCLCP
jgi:hypothetical protein